MADQITKQIADSFKNFDNMSNIKQQVSSDLSLPGSLALTENIGNGKALVTLKMSKYNAARVANKAPTNKIFNRGSTIFVREVDEETEQAVNPENGIVNLLPYTDKSYEISINEEFTGKFTIYM